MAGGDLVAGWINKLGGCDMVEVCPFSKSLSMVCYMKLLHAKSPYLVTNSYLVSLSR